MRESYRLSEIEDPKRTKIPARDDPSKANNTCDNQGIKILASGSAASSNRLPIANVTKAPYLKMKGRAFALKIVYDNSLAAFIGHGIALEVELLAFAICFDPLVIADIIALLGSSSSSDLRFPRAEHSRISHLDSFNK